MRVAYALFWFVIVGIAFGLSPPNRPDLWPWLGRLLTGDWAGENPLVVAHFQLMGVWPLVMAALLRREWARPGRLPAWPFLIGSFALGCFALVPYLALRRSPELGRPPVHAGVWWVLTGIGVGFLAWGLGAGSVADWAAGVRSDGFLWPMAWDFLAFCVVFAVEARGRLWGVDPTVG